MTALIPRTLTGTLVARTAVHAGTGEEDDAVGARLARDADGRPLLPGDGLRGGLRALATRLAPRLGEAPCLALIGAPPSAPPCACRACRLFGAINPGEASAARRAGLVWVYAAPQVDGAGPVVRDGLGVDRARRVAARRERAKFEREVAAPGAAFALRIGLEDGLEAGDERLLAAALAEWAAGRAVIGGHGAAGLGALELTGASLHTLDLDTDTGLMAYLRADRPWERGTHDPGWLARRAAEAGGRARPWTGPPDDGVARGWAELRLTLTADGPLLVADPVAAARLGVDAASVTESYADGAPAILPGATLRGALRARAETIARTLAGLRAGGDAATYRATCPACSPLEADPSRPHASCDALLRDAGQDDDAAVAPADLCLGCRLFGSPRRGGRLRVEDAPLAAGHEPRVEAVDRLALDRLTGGARAGAKFDAAPLWRPAFAARLWVEAPAAWELGWLALALRDLEDGLVRLGAGGAGRLRPSGWTLRLGSLASSDLPPGVPAAALAGSSRSGAYRVTELGPATAERALRRWAVAFLRAVRDMPRPAGLPLRAEGYLGTPLADFYPAEAMGGRR